MSNDFRLIASPISDRILHHRIEQNNMVISYEEILSLWRSDQDFCLWFTEQLKQSPFEAFRWETPVLTQYKISRDFEYVLVEAGSFVRRQTDRRAFSDYFSDAPVVCFPNLGGDGLMVVPCPQTQADVYGHFAAFLRGAPEEQILSLWRTLGAEVEARIDTRPKWLSTAGGGVAWLHVRLDSRPKYYHYQPYKDANYVKR